MIGGTLLGRSGQGLQRYLRLGPPAEAPLPSKERRPRFCMLICQGNLRKGCCFQERKLSYHMEEASFCGISHILIKVTQHF